MTTRTLQDLYLRRTACRHILKVLDTTEDPRQPDAVKHYKLQLASIDKQIADVTGKPPPIVIGLKTATLTGGSEKLE